MHYNSVLVGVDIGTSVVKSVAFDEKGRIVAISRRSNSFDSPKSNYAECSMDKTWELARETIQELVYNVPGGSQSIKAVGISGNMVGAWLIDENGCPVRPAILWNDGRSVDYLNSWRESGKLDEIFKIANNALSPGFSAVVLRWLKDNEPQILNRSKKLFFSKDWIRFKLTGQIYTDPSDGYHFPGDVNSNSYSREILRLCGIEDLEDFLPPVLNSGDVAGYIHRKAAFETGLPEGIPVITGLGDVSASLTGAGAIALGCTSVVLGTSCLISTVTPKPIFEPYGIGLSFYLPNGMLTRTLPNQTGTIAQDWFIREFWLKGQNDGKIDYHEMEKEVLQVPVGARGIIFHPYLNNTGVIAPIYEPRARARFWGLGLEHTRSDMLRSIFEGVGLAIADCLNHLPSSDGPIRLIGGASRSPLWQQVIADVTGRTLEIPDGEEFGALGVAMLAGVAVGIWSDLDQAIETCCKVGKTVTHDANNHEIYHKKLKLYQYLRKNLKQEYEMRGIIS